MKQNRLLAIIPTVLIMVACREVSVPRPRGYFRIDFPGKEYTVFEQPAGAEKLPFTFEYPVYGKISTGGGNFSDPGWFNIEFPGYKARIYLTYKEIKGDLAELIEQTYTMNVRNHISKADAIDEQIITRTDNRVYGILYDLKGSTATAVQFFVTDSIRHYLRGSLYFDAEPNPDSLAPVTGFFREDMIHMIETLKWEKW